MSQRLKEARPSTLMMLIGLTMNATYPVACVTQKHVAHTHTHAVLIGCVEFE